MSSKVMNSFGIDVFDDHQISLNLLVDQNAGSLDFNIPFLQEAISKIFYIVSEDHTIVIPEKEEYHSFDVKLKENDDEVFFIEFKYLRSIHPAKGELLVKDISTNTNPRLLANIIKIILSKFDNPGLLFGAIEIFFVEINRDIIQEDLSKLSDNEISQKLYKPLPSDHLLYKINQGGWVDDDGTMHEYP
jgi:hypothetical protein